MGFAEVYDIYWNQQCDPRTSNLPFMASPILIPSILIVYLFIVLKFGPEYMKNRKPYSLKTFVKCYNIFQIIFNAYIVQQFISAGWFTEISMFCEIPDFSNEPGPLKISFTMWLATMLKLIDLVETVVFVLRKKERQISFLHLYHHVSTLLISWLMTRYVPVAMASFALVVNCSVHVIMYTYYFMSAFGPTAQKILNPVKPLLTMIQMAQFIILMLQNAQAYLPYCTVSKIPSTVSITNLLINFALFYNFYKTSYKSAKKRS